MFVKITSQILLLSIILGLAACAGTPSPTPTAVVPPTPPPSPPTPPPTSIPTATPIPPPNGTPLHPLLGWTLAADGALYVLDATHTLFDLDPHSLAPLKKSESLAPTMGSNSLHLAADETRIFVGGGVLTQTLVLDRATLEPVTTLETTGVMAVDPGRRLFMNASIPISDTIKKAVVTYNLNNLSQPYEFPFGPPIVSQVDNRSGVFDITISPKAELLLLHNLSAGGSSPRNETGFRVINTNTLSETTYIKDPETGFTFFSRPAIVGQDGRILATTRRSFLEYINKLKIFSQQGEQLAVVETLKGLPAVDGTGEWIYILQDRGLWILRGDDLTLQSVLPFTERPPADLLVSPDNQILYLLGNGWLTALVTADLQQLGIPPFAGLPSSWGKPVFYGPIEYDEPVITGPQDVQFAQFDLEIYRSEDGGRNWQLLPAFSYRPSVPVMAFSISPNYNNDKTLIVKSYNNYAYRSTDGGQTLTKWEPPIAFTSDRDGNRDIYTMDIQGNNVQRRTKHPDSDENPAWSPGWTRLAFQSNRNGNWDIFTIRADCETALENCDLRQLTDDPADDMLPAWSPDGRHIAFVSTRNGNPEIYVMHSDGGNQIRLTFNEAGDWRPAWVPNSRELIFTSNRVDKNEETDNDLYWIKSDLEEESSNQSETYLLKQLTTDPADDRDAMVTAQKDSTGDYSTKILFLSDRDGLMRTYVLYATFKDPRIYDGYPTEQPHAHPGWGGQEKVIVAQQNDDIWNIIKYDGDKYSRLTDTDFFDGHPAGAPTWWMPEVEID